MRHLSRDTHQRVKTDGWGGSPGSHLDPGPPARTQQRKFREPMKSSEETRLEGQMLRLIKWLEEEGQEQLEKGRENRIVRHLVKWTEV